MWLIIFVFLRGNGIRENLKLIDFLFFFEILFFINYNYIDFFCVMCKIIYD